MLRKPLAELSSLMSFVCSGQPIDSALELRNTLAQVIQAREE